MRIERSVTSVSWIPSEAIAGIVALPFDLGITHYDHPPSDRLGDPEDLAARGRIRFANHLSAYIDVEDGAIADAGYTGRGYIAKTEVRIGPGVVHLPTFAYPDVQAEPVREADGVTFVQTAGGRTTLPSPRLGVTGRVGVVPPPAWTTLSLTVHSDGRSQHALEGASTFPRHWVYDNDGTLVEKSGTIDFHAWYRSRNTDPNPWAGADVPVQVAAVESELERSLSPVMFRSPRRRSLAPGEALIRQGERGVDLYFVLDGVFEVDVDGEVVAEVGPGAVLGEHGFLENGERTATLTAVSPARVAVVSGSDIDRDALVRLESSRRRE